jgi:RNA polymerase sigma-70 factor (ECF subfamily)
MQFYVFRFHLARASNQQMERSDTFQLISLCRAGDADAIESLVRRHQSLIYRLAVSILNDPAEADEATQDVFVAAINRLDSYRGEASFTTWLYAIALNVCRGRLRKRRVRERLTQAVHALFRVSGEAEAHPEQVVVQREADAALWQAIQALDDPLREVVILRYYHELLLDDIARVVGVSERSVRNRLHAAHERLRIRLGERSRLL